MSNLGCMRYLNLLHKPFCTLRRCSLTTVAAVEPKKIRRTGCTSTAITNRPSTRVFAREGEERASRGRCRSVGIGGDKQVGYVATTSQ